MNKRLLKSMLLGVALAGTMVSCQKDEFSNEMVPSHEMSLKEKAHFLRWYHLIRKFVFLARCHGAG